MILLIIYSVFFAFGGRSKILAAESSYSCNQFGGNCLTRNICMAKPGSHISPWISCASPLICCLIDDECGRQNLCVGPNDCDQPGFHILPLRCAGYGYVCCGKIQPTTAAPPPTPLPIVIDDDLTWLYKIVMGSILAVGCTLIVGIILWRKKSALINCLYVRDDGQAAFNNFDLSQSEDANLTLSGVNARNDRP